jgi:DNA adenine methylase
MKQAVLLPEFANEDTFVAEPINVASVPQRSPFRYPGGKTWFVPCFRRWAQSFSKKPNLLVEPFAGGGIISLTAAFEKLADRVLMVEIDDQIAAVWQTILGDEADWLAQRILDFEMTEENLLAELQTKRKKVREIAFQTILKNRTLHGGILAEGSRFMRYGERGRGIASRWYPQTIAKRIRNIALVADRIEFVHGDGMRVLEKYAAKRDAIFFIDPPYTAGGKNAGARLYSHYDIEHESLFQVCERLQGNFLMTYDTAEEVKRLARKHGFQMKQIAMQNRQLTKMVELVIGRDLDWLHESPRVFEKKAHYKARRRAS